MIEQAIQLATETPRSETAKGVAACYLPLNSDWGIKYYENRNAARVCYLRQKWAARYQLAPKVGQFFEFKDQYGDKQFGFITEKVFVYNTMTYEYCYFNDDRAVIDQLKAIGLYEAADIHGKNVGYTKKLRFVVLDFSFGYTDSLPVERHDIGDCLKKNNISVAAFFNARNYQKVV